MDSEVRGIFRSNLFWIGTVLKVILGSVLASDFMTEYFTPFVNYFLSSGFSNPYEYFFSNGVEEAFPYPPVMLASLSVFKAPFAGFIGDPHTVTWFDLLLMRLPFLVADFMILLVLAKWLKSSGHKLILIYWLNPVLIYISYIHGQLDVIPVALLLLSIHFFLKNKLTAGGILIGLCIAAKFNMIITVPFLALYLFKGKRRSLSASLMPFFWMIGTLVLANIPIMGSDAAMQMVYNNPVQQAIFTLNFAYGEGLFLYFAPAAFILLFFHGSTFKVFNKYLFILFIGFTLGIITIFTPVMQGWYYWVLPFLIFFLLKQGGDFKFSFWCLNFAYFLYFLVTEQSDYFEVFQVVAPQVAQLPNLHALIGESKFSVHIIGLAFTMLQSLMIINCYWIYKEGIRRNRRLKLLYEPLLIGVGGDSGSGKTSFASAIIQIFGQNNTSVLCGDDMHKWERGDENWKNFTHLHPKANLLHKEVKFINDLKRGQKIWRRRYDHDNGKFTLEESVRSNKVLIYEGLHPFYLNNMRKSFDVKVFIHPDESLRLYWKVKRDSVKRGYTREQVLEQLKKREDDSINYIQTQAAFADVQISFKPKTDLTEHFDEELTMEDLFVEMKIDNSIDINELVDKLNEFSTNSIEYISDVNSQYVRINSGLEPSKIQEVMYEIIPEIDEFIEDHSPTWKQGLNGVIQLLVLYVIYLKINLRSEADAQ